MTSGTLFMARTRRAHCGTRTSAGLKRARLLAREDHERPYVWKGEWRARYHPVDFAEGYVRAGRRRLSGTEHLSGPRVACVTCHARDSSVRKLRDVKAARVDATPQPRAGGRGRCATDRFYRALPLGPRGSTVSGREVRGLARCVIHHRHAEIIAHQPSAIHPRLSETRTTVPTSVSGAAPCPRAKLVTANGQRTASGIK